MAHDLVIKNGTLIDGSGSEPIRADVIVNDGRITGIGDSGLEKAEQVLDATGRIVTPGFIDAHTHLDAQVGWDPALTSSIYHGITTVLVGNCGVTFAPVSPGNESKLAEIMEGVEDISAKAIMTGLPWSWTGYGGYLDAVQALKPALNIVGLVGHAAVRYDVMGDRAIEHDAVPTDAEIVAIAARVRESVAAGAVGFSTSRLHGHAVPDGRQMPGTFARMKELRAIQQAVVEGGGHGAIFQFVPEINSLGRTMVEVFKGADPEILLDPSKTREFLVMTAAAEAGCHVMFSGGALPFGDGCVGILKDFLESSNARGRRITTLIHSRPSGSLLGLAQLPPFKGPAWAALVSLPTLDQRLDALRDPSKRAVLVKEAREFGFRLPPAQIHPMGVGEKPNYDLDSRASLADLAREAGVDPIELVVDRLIASDGRELFNGWNFGANLEAQWRLMQSANCLPGLGDAGAHVGEIIDADSTTFVLASLARDRGIMTIPKAVHKLTGMPASVLGLKERGQVKEGWHADLNIIDLEALGSTQPVYQHDFPYNGGRFVVQSTGYDATIVGGQVVIQKGELTGQRPGQVIREFLRG